eukprot:Polyplicarium_translucidae@DN4106_c0_g1_i1.p1
MNFHTLEVDRPGQPEYPSADPTPPPEATTTAEAPTTPASTTTVTTTTTATTAETTTEPEATTAPPVAPPLYPPWPECGRPAYDSTQDTGVVASLWIEPEDGEALRFHGGGHLASVSDRHAFLLYTDDAQRAIVRHMDSETLETEAAFVDPVWVYDDLWKVSNAWAIGSDERGNLHVMPDPHYRIRIAHVVESTGYVAEHSLDPEPDCFIREHPQMQGFSIGMDEKGYLHVTGDMIFFPVIDKYTAGLPSRYEGAECMAWRSDNPMDVSSSAASRRSIARAFRAGQAGAPVLVGICPMYSALI